MMAQQRFDRIVEYLTRHRAASVAELCVMTGASEPTIRRDLTELARQGCLRKVHGGAVAVRPLFEAQEADVHTRERLQVPQKDAIARYAAGMIQDDDLVFLDAGTTTLHMVEYLTDSKATFVTNGVACARRMVEQGLRAYVLGGLLKPRTQAVVGGVALGMLANYNFTKAFLGMNGISVERGYTTPDTEEACIKEKAVQRAFASYVLADSTKFGKASAITVCSLEQAHIITDYLPDEAYRQFTVIKEVQA